MSPRALAGLIAAVVASSSQWPAGTIGIESARFGTAEVETADGMTVLEVEGEQVTIYRDELGVPHIFAETNRGAFEAYGYAVAEDRLWQLEVNRHAAQGRLAEIFGASQVASDRTTRTLGYTSDELDAQWAQASAEEQVVYSAYVNGINRYILEVVATDPVNKLPFEFHVLGLDVPAPWTTRDAVAYAVLQARLFFDRGDTERTNQTLLASLTAMHGVAAAQGIFNDVQWINDPDAPTSVPVTGADGPRQHPTLAKGQLDGAGEATREALGDPGAALAAVGIPSSLGSYGWVVSAARSAEQAAILVGGPQLTITTPDIAHEVQIKAGDMNVGGLAFAGLPFVLIGRNNHISWTAMTALANNVDTYVETTCDGGAGYIYNGVCTPYERRTETILVRNAAPVTITVERSIHGPVTATAGTTKFTRKARQRNREFETFRAFLAIDKADSIASFKGAMDRFVGVVNVLYADSVGNIAYFRPGETPVRPAGFDIRLPLPGDGTAEWTGELLPMPQAINPARGWLANWNNKAAIDDDIADGAPAGKQARVREIEMMLERPNQLSLQDMRDMVEDISRTTLNGAGRNSRYIKPYLLAALDAVPSPHPLAAQARAVLEEWDGSVYADIGSTAQEAGEVVFTTWIMAMRAAIFADELGANAGRATVNVLTHCLELFFTGTTGVPPSRDYFNGVHPYVELSDAFTNALTTLGSNPAAWSSRPRDVTLFRHALFPAVPQVASIFETNKGTYVQIVVHHRPKLTSENIVILGQSGFIGRQGNTPVFDAHYRDQLEMYRTFKYKPMILYKNVQLQD